MLAGKIADISDHARFRRKAAGDDNGTLAPFGHGREHVAQGPEQRGHVNAHHRFEGFVGIIGRRGEHAFDSGVEEQPVYGAGTLDRLVHGCRDPGLVADVGCDPLCCRADGFGLAFQNVGAAGDHGHCAAECGDPPRSGKADPAGGSGDDDVLCGEIHFILSL